MIIMMRPDASEREVEQISEMLRAHGLAPRRSHNAGRTVIGALGTAGATSVPGLPELCDQLREAPGVEAVLPVSQPYQLASREFHPEPTEVRIPAPAGEVVIGGEQIVMMAGPCTVESEAQLLAAAPTSPPPRPMASVDWVSPDWNCWRERGRRRGWRWSQRS